METICAIYIQYGHTLVENIGKIYVVYYILQIEIEISMTTTRLRRSAPMTISPQFPQNRIHYYSIHTSLLSPSLSSSTGRVSACYYIHICRWCVDAFWRTFWHLCVYISPRGLLQTHSYVRLRRAHHVVYLYIAQFAQIVWRFRVMRVVRSDSNHPKTGFVSLCTNTHWTVCVCVCFFTRIGATIQQKVALMVWWSWWWW